MGRAINIRTISKPPRDSGWLKYHREMTEKHAYFVSGDGLAPFYTDEHLDELLKSIDGIPYAKIINCDWTSDAWQDVPYFYTIGLAGYTEYYTQWHTKRANHASYKPAGKKQAGEWIEKYFEDTAGETGWTSFKWHNDGYCSVIHVGHSYTRHPNGSWYIMGAYEPVEIGSHPPDRLIPQARRMRAEKWGGFYEDIVEFLINDGLDELQI